ncbi:MAG: amino acid aminotransferase [Rubripirellula sp.]
MTASNGSEPSLRFSSISTAPPDPILGLTEAFLADQRSDKMNLSVGVYKDASGQTPVLESVKAAEQRLLETETTKGYLPIDGLPDYQTALKRMVFGDVVPADRIATLQSPGGTGALRTAASFLASQMPPLRVWASTPTWANHHAVFDSEGLPVESYRYLAADRTSLDFDGMLDDLTKKAQPGDAVLLHACCHNPTGIDPSSDQWEAIAKTLSERGLLPLIDFAYQGFGHGIREDAKSIETILRHNTEAIVCNSFSKNFGLYGERVGAVSFVSADSSTANAIRSQLKKLVRCNYSNPPRHGGSIVATVLGCQELTEQWQRELAAMRDRIKALREQFVSTMQQTGKGHDFSFLLNQCGMFSFSGLNKMQVDQLKTDHGIYIVGSGRINVAGMQERKMDFFCSAVAQVLEA